MKNFENIAEIVKEYKTFKYLVEISKWKLDKLFFFQKPTLC